MKHDIVCMACEAWDEPHAWHEGGQDRRPIEAGGKCWRPKDHRGACGEPLNQAEDEDRILYGQCGAPPAPTHVLHASDKGTRWL